MTVTPESARAYLRKALDDAGIKKNAASRIVGHDHAYISQYLGDTRKPLWLGEPEIRRLAKSVPGLDPDQLRQPSDIPGALSSTDPERAGGQREEQPQINLQRLGKLIDKPGALKLLEAYGRIDNPVLRDLAVDMISRLASTRDAVAA